MGFLASLPRHVHLINFVSQFDAMTVCSVPASFYAKVDSIPARTLIGMCDDCFGRCLYVPTCPSLQGPVDGFQDRKADYTMPSHIHYSAIVKLFPRPVLVVCSTEATCRRP